MDDCYGHLVDKTVKLYSLSMWQSHWLSQCSKSHSCRIRFTIDVAISWTITMF